MKVYIIASSRVGAEDIAGYLDLRGKGEWEWVDPTSKRDPLRGTDEALVVAPYGVHLPPTFKRELEYARADLRHIEDARLVLNHVRRALDVRRAEASK